MPRCIICGRSYRPTGSNQKLCGRKECWMDRRRQRRAKDHTRPCSMCGTPFVPRHPSNACCSDACRTERKRQYHRRWRAANRGRTARSRAKYYAARPERRAAEYAQYKTRHLERLLVYWRGYRVRRASEIASAEIAALAAELQRRSQS